ncbi:MAG: beta-galactosidase GalB [Luteolibacter sp.]
MKALLHALIISIVLPVSLSAKTQRVSFDDDWKFARFGKMADGSIVAEPGTPPTMLRASSEESGNPASFAADGNAQSRWCASSDAKNQWLQYDLGAVANIGGVRIHWEKVTGNPFKIEISDNGASWNEVVASRPIRDEKMTLPLNARARMVRVTADGSQGSWASIREIEVLDRNNKPITPRDPSGDKVVLRPEAPDFDDHAWRQLNLPHDWAIEGPFHMSIENETGKLPWEGIGWYRKQFDVPRELGQGRIYLDFDGAMSQPKVYVNGQLAGEWAYGYNSFRVDITPYIEAGKRATVAVRLENLPQSTRWYPGAGIYRHVYLTVAPPTSISHWGVYVTTPRITDDSATLEVQASVDHRGNDAASLRITHEVLEDGNVVASAGTTVNLAPGKTDSSMSRIELKNPKRWDIESPHLYQLRTRIYRAESLLDETTTRFGVREIKWDAQDGFLLNGRKVVLKGVCQHHDLGPLGSAVHKRAIERQIEILMEMGVNSIRTAHNPPAPEFLELCDEMGILVINELFDIWKLQKYGKTNGYNIFWDEWHEKDVRNFMLRDRNHPSIIAWSTGNEIPELGRTDHHWVPMRLRELMRQYDTTRPVTAGSNDPAAARNGFQKSLDAYGVNYHLGSYQQTLDALPDMPVYASETSSTVSTRGEYFFPVSWDKSQGFYDFQVSSYDLYAPGWANRPDLQFEALDDHPRFAGEYVWTGFDYIGEPTPYNQDQTNALNFRNPEERAKAMEELRRLGNRAPSRSSYFGILDLCGFKKDRFYLYQSRWIPEKPMAHILPHWNWPERVSMNVPVHVYTNGDEAELFLNGKSLGVRRKGEPHRYRLVWDDVKYQAGELKVVVRKDGKSWSEATLSTTGEASAVEAFADRSEIVADGRDLSYITIRAVDSKGREVPRTRLLVQIQATGPIDIIGVCNGDPTDQTTMKPADPSKASIAVFNGLAQVVVRSRRGQAGSGVITVTAEGIPSAKLTIVTR